jgi:hypothetical protein
MEIDCMDYGQFIDIEEIQEIETNRENNNWYTVHRHRQRINEDEGFIVLLKMIVQMCKMIGL